MTLLQHEALREALTARELADRLVVTPLLDPAQIGEASIDLRLGTDFLVLRRTVRAGFDIAAGGTRAEIDSLYERVVVPLAGELWIHPRQFILGATLEFVRLPASLGGYVLGRSSWGRLGLLVATAVMVQPGFAGCLTLELVNEGESPIRLAPGLRVAQLAVHALSAATLRDYGASGAETYRSPVGPQPARLAKDEADQRKLEELERALRRR